MVLNGYGEIVREEWLRSSKIRSEIRLGEYVIMPNHFHAIVYIVDHRDDRRGDGPWGDRPVAPTGSKPKSLGAFMAGFKSAVTKRINAMRNTPGMSVWQRNYYEHVIRNETDYHRIAEYIADNPRC
jgi:REP element-mobilizing transposase RayT